MTNTFRLFLLALLLPVLASAQHMGPSFSLSKGIITCKPLENAGFKATRGFTGYSAGWDFYGVMGFAAISFRYDNMVSTDKMELASGGYRHMKLSQRLAKPLIGYGGLLGDKALFAVQFGFTVGKDYVYVWREYEDGTISYGIDNLRSGVWEGFRPLAPLVSLSGGFAIKDGFTVFAHAERMFGKGVGDENLFHDWNFHKEEYLWLNQGGSGTMTYLGDDRIPGWKLELGLKYLIDIGS